MEETRAARWNYVTRKLPRAPDDFRSSRVPDMEAAELLGKSRDNRPTSFA